MNQLVEVDGGRVVDDHLAGLRADQRRQQRPDLERLVDPFTPRPDQAGGPFVAEHFLHALEGAERSATERVAVEVDQLATGHPRCGHVELVAPRGQRIGAVEGERVVAGDHALQPARSKRAGRGQSSQRHS
jgi:hypothetical protein